MTVDVVVEIAVVPGRMDDALAGFTALARRTRAEPGCLQFEILVPEAMSNALILTETWSDQEAIDLHMRQDYTLDFIATSADFLAAAPAARNVRRVAV